MHVKREVAFISISDLFYQNNNDTLPFSNFQEQNKKNTLKDYFVLEGAYRKNYLQKCKITEQDSLFIYDYANNILQKFRIRNLKLAASLSAYVSLEDNYIREDDFQIGFEIDRSNMKGTDTNYNFTLATVNSNNPFEIGKMQMVNWEKIAPNSFPVSLTKKLQQKECSKFKATDSAYYHANDSFEFYIQDIDIQLEKYILNERFLWVVSKPSGKLLIERSFHESEGISLTPLNNYFENEYKEQWTGHLLKNKPSVIFGFKWMSFGCSRIMFLENNAKDLFLSCDNRH